MGADLGVPLSDLRPLCVSVAGGESRKTFTQFSRRENVKTRERESERREKERERERETAAISRLLQCLLVRLSGHFSSTRTQVVRCFIVAITRY